MVRNRVERRRYAIAIVATAEDQARALLFLGSDLAGYVNGVNLLVDGGYSAALQMGQVALPGQ